MEAQLQPMSPADRKETIDLFNHCVEQGFAEVGRFRNICIKPGGRPIK
jgi:hypothetical protein